MKPTCVRTLTTAFILIGIPAIIYAQPTNDNCSGVITVTPSSTCTNTTYNIKNATNSSPTGACGGATSSTTYDMWFRFQASATSHSITLSSFGSSLSCTLRCFCSLFFTCRDHINPSLLAPVLIKIHFVLKQFYIAEI